MGESTAAPADTFVHEVELAHGREFECWQTWAFKAR